MKKTEKVVISRTPETVRINIEEIPKHETDYMCRTILKEVAKAFQNPKFAAEYEQWRAERAAAQQEKGTSI